MAVGYTRQSSGLIVSGATILASHFNNEFNAIESAFHATTGHTHDGTGGGGAKIVLTTGVSGTLPVANGGTGGTTAGTAKTALELPFRGSTNVTSGSTAVATADNGLVYTADTTSGNVTLTLPLAATAGAGFFFAVVKTNVANQVILDPSGVELIQSGTTFNLDGDDDAAIVFCDGSVWHVMGTEYPASAFSKTLLIQTAASGYRTDLGLNIGSDVQAYDAGLLSIAGLTTSADKMIYATASDTYSTTDLTAFARTILDDVDAAAVRTTIGAAASAGAYQPLDAGLTSISDLTTAADKLPYTTASDVYAVTDFTAFARTLLADASAAAGLTTLGGQTLDAGLTSISGLVTAADKMIYTTASDVYAVTDLSSFARTVIDDADGGAIMTTLGITAYAQTILDDATAAAAQATLGVPPNERDIIAGTGLSGGGTLAADRTINMDIASLASVTAATGDEIAIADVGDADNIKKVTAQSIADLAASGQFTLEFTSTDQTITSAGSLTLAHSLGVAPKLVAAFLVSQGSNNGYSTGEVFPINVHQSGGTNRGNSLEFDATNINVRFGSDTNAYIVINATSGATESATNSNYKLRVKAWA
ncbi:MAG: hypothetical protein ACXABY_15835 [Candidatus Thorarchaeota archaeon]|jgi:hypothetical protein